MKEKFAVQCWLGLAVIAVVVQEWLTTYPVDGAGPHVFGGGVSLFLLYRIYRGGRVARAIFLALATIGVAVYASGLGSDSRYLWLSLAFAVQMLVMLAAPVRAWTRQDSQAARELPEAA